MAIYNDTLLDNVTNPLDMITAMQTMVVNNGYLTQHIFGYMILLAFFLIFLILGVRYQLDEVFLIDGILSTVMAILLYGTGLLPGAAIIFPAFIFMISLIFFFIKN